MTQEDYIVLLLCLRFADVWKGVEGLQITCYLGRCEAISERPNVDGVSMDPICF